MTSYGAFCAKAWRHRGLKIGQNVILSLHVVLLYHTLIFCKKIYYQTTTLQHEMIIEKQTLPEALQNNGYDI